MSSDGAPARFALLLHGKIGRLNTSASIVVRDQIGASRELITLCSRTHLHFIVAANRGSAGGVDVTGHHSNPADHQQIDWMTPCQPSRVHCQVFVHTWNPDDAAFIDASYGPHLRASKHQPVEQRNNQCRKQGGPDFGHLPLRRLIFAPAYAPGRTKLRPASANQPLGLLRGPAIQGPCLRHRQQRSLAVALGWPRRTADARPRAPAWPAVHAGSGATSRRRTRLAVCSRVHGPAPRVAASHVRQRGRTAVLTGPQLGSCAPSGHLWRLGAVSHSQGTGRPTGRPAPASGGSSHRRLQTSPLTTQVQLLEEGPRRTVHERTRGERGAADVRSVRRDGAPSCRAHVAPSDRHALVRRTSRGPRTSEPLNPTRTRTLGDCATATSPTRPSSHPSPTTCGSPRPRTSSVLKVPACAAHSTTSLFPALVRASLLGVRLSAPVSATVPAPISTPVSQGGARDMERYQRAVRHLRARARSDHTSRWRPT